MRLILPRFPKNRTFWINFLYTSNFFLLTYFFLGEKMQFFYEKNNEISRPALLASFSKTASANNPSPLVSYEVARTAKTPDRLTPFL